MPQVILFVDDEPEVLGLLRRAFSGVDGYEVLAASNGEEALRILSGRAVDLLVTDQRMPRMSGIELIERARRGQPELCAILLTAHTDPRDIVDAINRGQVYRYVVKPWEVPDLRQTVAGALEHVALRRERARLLAEAERRLAALKAVLDIVRDVGVADAPARLLERIVDHIPQVVPCDVAAALLAAPGEPPKLIIRPVAELSEGTLLQIKEDLLAAHRRNSGGGPLDETGLQLRVTAQGRAGAVEGFASRLEVPALLAGTPVGVVLVASAAADAFGEGEARVLDLLVNEMAESFRAACALLTGERERLSRVVESLADGLLYAPMGSDDVVANPAARRMLGAPIAGALQASWLKQALGFYPFDLVRGHDATPEGAYVTEEIRIGDRTLASTVSAVAERGGGLAGVAVVLRDVTEQKQLEERKEEFIHVVSHELRTPLTSITGALDLVLGGLAGEIAPKQARYLRMARESADRLNELVDDLLDVARLAKGKLHMQPEVVVLDDVVRAAVDRYAPAAAERGHELLVDAPGTPRRIIGDGARLGQVVSNLLTNAIKFTPERGAIQIRLLRSSAISGLTGFTVWNGGEGIAEEDLERIFEKFEQSRSERTRRVRGTGLGLPISRGIVEAHGGCIWAESPPGGGATFAVVLREEPPANPEERPPLPADAPVALVVDEPDTAILACGVLRAAGIAARRAHDVEDALAVARRCHPRLVLLDPLLPAMRGVPLAEILHHDADTRRAVVLGFSLPLGRELAFRAGADAFVEKPSGIAALSDAATALVRRDRTTGARVVVVDDDPAIRAICAEVLRGHGYEVDEAGDCATARRLVIERRPQVVLFDVQLPDGDGFSLLSSLAERRASEPFAAVFLSARGETADKVRGLRLGADDYLTKPFDAQELVARIDAVLRRRDAALHASPMTRLPGGRAIDEEVQRRLDRQVAFALTYIDLDNLKAYNDTYGYAKADGVVLQTAGILREAVATFGGEGAFLGHVGGDDFVMLSTPERAKAVCDEIIAAFDRVIPLYYDREDRERGYIEAADRFGTRRRFSILSLSMATVVAAPSRFQEHAALARVAAELKDRAKRIPGSVHLVDDGVIEASA